jgi:adenylate cyclase
MATEPLPVSRRHLAAILAADVVGYSHLMGADETGTLDRLRACRKEIADPIVARHGGRIVKLSGDGVLCEFPSAVEAVQAAVEIQAAMAERNAAQAEGEPIELRMASTSATSSRRMATSTATA